MSVLPYHRQQCFTYTFWIVATVSVMFSDLSGIFLSKDHINCKIKRLTTLGIYLTESVNYHSRANEG